MGDWGAVDNKMKLLADMIKTRPHDEWPGALAYILVCLEGTSGDDKFEEALAVLRNRIDVRLSEGNW